MTTPVRRHGFTYIEVLLAMAMAAVLGAIGLPRFFEAQKHAKRSEAISNLKQLRAAMSAQQTMPTSIHVPGFDPDRGNYYSYHLSDSCTSFEDRSGAYAVTNATDTCIGVDTYDHPTLPSLFQPAPIAVWDWSQDPRWDGMMGGFPGIFGSGTSWNYLAFAASNLDNDPNDTADTWAVGSLDGRVWGWCPSTWDMPVTAGEPFLVNADIEKKCR